MRYVFRQGALVIVAVIVASLIALALFTLSHPIEEFPEALAQTWLVPVVDLIASIVSFIRELVTALLKLDSGMQLYQMLDAFILFDIALLVWFLGVGLVEGKVSIEIGSE